MLSSMALSGRDLKAMVDIARDPGDEFGAYGLPTAVLVAVKNLIACDTVSFCQNNAEEPARSFDQSLPVEMEDWTGIDQLPAESPGIWCPATRADFVNVVKVSDFYSRRQFHATRFYTDYLIDCEHHMVLPFADRTGGTLNMFFFRGRGPDFSERDRAVLTLLRPHIDRSFQATEDRRGSRIRLTARQEQLLRLVAGGHSNRDIARRLWITEATVRKHLENIFERLQVTSRTAAVAVAFPDRGPARPPFSFV
jgi:DNA-binding CsgD family transcriptional regulator